MNRTPFFLCLALVLSVVIVSGCETTAGSATSPPVTANVEPSATDPASSTDAAQVTPTDYPTQVPGPDVARDAAVAYIAENYGALAPAAGLDWNEENVTPEGLVGSSRFQYTTGDWIIMISFPIVAPQATIYQVVVYNSATGFQWEGELNAEGHVAEQAPNLGAGVGYQGVSFSYDHAIATDVVGNTVSAFDSSAGWEVVPEHTEFKFNSYVLPTTFHEPRIIVYPVNEFEAKSEIAEDIMSSLQVFLAEEPAAPDSIPFLPMFNAAQMLQAHVAYVDFQNGAGVRFLTQYGQDISPINNHDLFYTFQGLTDDGRYYVAAILPVSHPELPADGTEIPGGYQQAFANNYESYVAEIEQLLNAQDLSSFTPNLSLLDVMIQSLEVSPPPATSKD